MASNMFKKVLCLFVLTASTISLTGCSFKNEDSSKYIYVPSYFDDDTEGNAFLINRVQDLNTIIYSDKTDRTALEQFNNDYFENNSLIVFKIINNNKYLRRIKKFSFDGKNIGITIPKQLTNAKQSHYFYLIKTEKVLAESLEWINIYEGNRLLNKAKVQEEEYYDFLSNFDLNISKRPLFDMHDLYLERYLDISLKKPSAPFLKAKKSILELNLLFQSQINLT